MANNWYVMRTEKKTGKVRFYSQGDEVSPPKWVTRIERATAFVCEEYAQSAARGIAAIEANTKVRMLKSGVQLPVFTFDAREY